MKSKTLDEKEVIMSKIEQAEKIIIGAGAGLSAAAGLTYSGKRFEDNFSDFIVTYHLSDMYSAGFYEYPTKEINWAYWSRHIMMNRYVPIQGDVYRNLLKLVEEKDYFVITTNVDHAFIRSGFDKNRIFYTQGNYGLFQCSKPCHDETYDNEEIVKKMVKQQQEMKIPSELIPYCPKCGAEMTTNLRKDNTFVQDKGWYEAMERYQETLDSCKRKRSVYLELGVGYNTPGIIKYPFWQQTYENPDATYICINVQEEHIPKEITTRSIAIKKEINEIL
ncbi:MAG: Sir2 silent information regulator family NAD-dependent deacetylase [Eubacteriales bacterium]